MSSWFGDGGGGRKNKENGLIDNRTIIHSSSNFSSTRKKDNNTIIDDASFSWSCEIQTRGDLQAKLLPSNSSHDKNDSGANYNNDKNYQETLQRRYPQKLLLVFAVQRSGSTLLQGMLRKIDDATNNADAFVLALGELFHRNPMAGRSLHKFIKKVCPESTVSGTTSWFNSSRSENNQGQQHDTATLSSNTSTVMGTTTTSPLVWAKKLETCLDERNKNPRQLLKFVRGVPSVSDHGFVSFKIMPNQMNVLNLSVDQFMKLILEVWNRPNDVSVIVQWRRRLIEGYVSRNIAHSIGDWHGKQTNENNSITVSKKDVLDYANGWKEYYRSVRRTLQDHRDVVSYEVVEYGRDLMNETVQIATVERILRLLGIPSDQLAPGWNDTEQFQTGLSTKQSKVPVEKHVNNWEVVKQLGLDGEVPDWNDGF